MSASPWVRSRPGKPNQRKGQNEKFIRISYFDNLFSLLQSGVTPANQTKERGKTKSLYEFRPLLCEFAGVFPEENKHDSHWTFVPECPCEKFMNWPFFGLVCRGHSWLGGRFLLKFPEGGGGSPGGEGRGAGKVSAANWGIWGGGGAKYFFSGLKCPPSFCSMSYMCSRAIEVEFPMPCARFICHISVSMPSFRGSQAVWACGCLIEPQIVHFMRA